MSRPAPRVAGPDTGMYMALVVTPVDVAKNGASSSMVVARFPVLTVIKPGIVQVARSLPLQPRTLTTQEQPPQSALISL